MSIPESALLDDREPDTEASSDMGESALADQAAALRRTAGMENNPANALEKALKKHSGTQQLVLLQDFPDPDALSSAWAYRLIASAYNIQCDLYYSGTLSHQENIALVKLTNLPARRWPANEKEAPDLSNYQGYV